MYFEITTDWTLKTLSRDICETRPIMERPSTAHMPSSESS